MSQSPGFASGAASSAPPSRLSVEQLGAAFEALRKAMSHVLQDERDAAEELIERAATVLNLSSVRAEAPQESGTYLAPWQTRKVTHYIEANLGSSLSVDQIAACVGRSPGHFSRSFKYTFGESPHRYLQRRRIERSQGLMLQTKKSIADIALDCGLADQAHFGRVFRNLVGETPAAWRRARVEGS
jgi:AraC family transcriptional regulator